MTHKLLESRDMIIGYVVGAIGFDRRLAPRLVSGHAKSTESLLHINLGRCAMAFQTPSPQSRESVDEISWARLRCVAKFVWADEALRIDIRGAIKPFDAGLSIGSFDEGTCRFGLHGPSDRAWKPAGSSMRSKP